MKAGENKGRQVVLSSDQVEFPKGLRLYEGGCSTLRALLAKKTKGETCKC